MEIYRHRDKTTIKQQLIFLVRTVRSWVGLAGITFVSVLTTVAHKIAAYGKTQYSSWAVLLGRRTGQFQLRMRFATGFNYSMECRAYNNQRQQTQVSAGLEKQAVAHSVCCLARYIIE